MGILINVEPLSGTEAMRQTRWGVGDISSSCALTVASWFVSEVAPSLEELATERRFHLDLLLDDIVKALYFAVSEGSDGWRQLEMLGMWAHRVARETCGIDEVFDEVPATDWPSLAGEDLCDDALWLPVIRLAFDARLDQASREAARRYLTMRADAIVGFDSVGN